MADVSQQVKPISWSSFGSYASGRQSSDGVKGYKSVTFRPTSPSSLSSVDTVKRTTSQQKTNSSRFSTDSASEPTTNGAVWSLPVKIRAQKLASLPTPFNNVPTTKSATSALNSETATTTTSVSSTSIKWTPVKTDSEDRQPTDDADKHVAGISVLKHDKLDSSASLSSDVVPSNTWTSMSSKNDSHANAIDISDIENSLSDEWWDSLFKPSASEDSTQLSQRVEHSPARLSAPAESRDPAASCESVKSTAAVLRLSDALQRAPRSQTDGVSTAQYSSLSDRSKNEDDNILSEWKSDISTSEMSIKKGPRTMEYDKQKEASLLKRRPEGVTQRDAREELDMLYEMLEQPWKTSSQSNADFTKTEKKLVKFEGIGPTEEQTGVPIATRTSIDEENRKDWYRHMYNSLHKTNKSGSSGVNKSSNSVHRVLSPHRDNAELSHYRYRDHRYKNQPLKIEDYEPGFHSSIAHKQAKTSESERLLESLKSEGRDETDGLSSSKHSPSAQRKRRTGTSRSRDNQVLRQQWDEENYWRRMEVERVLESERRKRHVDEMRDAQARRHSDHLNPLDKCSMLLNRFDDDDLLLTADSLDRPEYRRSTRVRGKARAIHTFRAQNNRELPLRKGDTVYLLQQVDTNWFKGERHGTVGIFPVNHVEVLTSLDEAYITAGLKEGKAWAKYSFKGQSPKELSLRKGDVVKLIRRLDENWYEARAGARQGIVPVIYVETTREPETPLMTPMSSRAPTPTLGVAQSGRYSPASSIISVGPDIPTAPESPWTSDFYDSEVDSDNPRRSRSRDGDVGSREATHERPRTTSTSRQPPSPSATNYMQYRSRNILDRGPYHWPTSAPSTLERPGADGRRSNTVPRDLFYIARRRRAGDTDRLEDWINGLLSQSTRPTSTSVRAQSSSPLRSQPTTSSTQLHVIDTKFPRYRVLFDYTPRHIDELQINARDMVQVMEKCDDGWYVGTSERTGEFGTFPGNYVELVAAQ